VALAGLTVMLIAAGLAWPRPLPLLAVCALNFVALTAVAFRCRLPLAHAAALPCLVVGYLTGFYLLGGRLALADDLLPGRMRDLASSAETGTALLAMFLVLGAVAELLARLGHFGHGRCYALGAVGVALASLALVTPRGLDEPGRAAVVYAVYGAGILT